MHALKLPLPLPLRTVRYITGLLSSPSLEEQRGALDHADHAGAGTQVGR